MLLLLLHTIQKNSTYNINCKALLVFNSKPGKTTNLVLGSCTKTQVLQHLLSNPKKQLSLSLPRCRLTEIQNLIGVFSSSPCIGLDVRGMVALPASKDDLHVNRSSCGPKTNRWIHIEADVYLLHHRDKSMACFIGRSSCKHQRVCVFLHTFNSFRSS